MHEGGRGKNQGIKRKKKIPGNQSNSLDLKLCFQFKIIIYKSWLTVCLCCFYATYKQSCSHIYFSGLTDTFVVCSLATETGKNLPAPTKSPKCSDHPITSLKVQDVVSPPPQGIKGQSRALITLLFLSPRAVSRDGNP